MNSIKKFLLLLTVSVLFLSSCNVNSSKLIVDNDNYSVILEKDECFLVPKKDFSLGEEHSVSPELNITPVLTGIGSDTIDELYIKIISNTFTKSELSYMQRYFEKDENGRIFICNPNNLLVPLLPQQAEAKKVYLNGGGYYFSLSFSDITYGYFSVPTEEVFIRNYEENYENFLDNQLLTLVKTKSVAERNATEYYYTTDVAELKKVQYTLKSGNKKICVDETYVLKLDNNAFAVSDTVPNQINLYIYENDEVAEVLLYDFTSRPTEEWLLSFGMEPYVPET